MAGPSRWSVADPLAALLWVAWILAAATAAWLVFSVVISVATRLVDTPVLSLLADRLALPAIRRLVERVSAVSLVVSTLVAPANAALAQDPDAPPIPIVAVVEPSMTVDGQTAPPTPPSTQPVPVEPSPRLPASDAAVAPVPLPPATTGQGASDPPVTEHTVRAGENLWAISCDVLTARLGRTPSDPETASYWSAVIDANLADLRSGDPDLIFPGEVITLPGQP